MRLNGKECLISLGNEQTCRKMTWHRLNYKTDVQILWDVKRLFSDVRLDSHAMKWKGSQRGEQDTNGTQSSVLDASQRMRPLVTQCFIRFTVPSVQNSHFDAVKMIHFATVSLRCCQVEDGNCESRENAHDDEGQGQKQHAVERWWRFLESS